jgi:phage terminase large subunit GpA-like protein
MDCKIELGLDAFRQACRPPQRLLPSDYAHDRVAIYEGKSPYYDKHATPWMNEPLDQLANPECTELILLAPTGSGKTTMMEAALAYIVAEDPGPTLIIGQTNETISEWFETRLMHTFRNTPETKDLIPSGKHRHKARKDAIIFPHMTLFSTGANISGTQARSMRRVIADEPWTYKAGIIRQAEARLHDRHNRQFILVSQGGTIGDDWHEKWMQTNQRERHFCCPKCQTEQTWQWANVKYDEVQGDDVATSKTARIACVNADCDFEIAEDAELRRRLSMNARYIQTTTGVDGSFGYRFSMLENWQVPLSRIVLERIKAMREVSRGNLELLKSFIQKRLADWWNDEQEDARPVLTGAGYSVKDYANGEKWEDEFVRFMTIDRQQDHFWVGIRAWAEDGRSRLLWFGKVDTWDRLKVIQETYKVENRKTQIDCGYQKDEVYKRCAQYGWFALRGDQRDSYPHKGRDGKTTYKAFSRYQVVTASDGRKTMAAFFSNLAIKDILHQLRNGKGVEWQIPDDVGSDYLQQIDAEVRRGEGRSAIWKARRRDNHAVDIEAEQIVLASVLGLIGNREETEEKE